jgi:lipopolysaccharide export system permease protein
MEMTADKRYLVFTLFNGVNYDENVPLNNRSNARYNEFPTSLQRTQFKKEIQRIDLSAFAFKKSSSDLYRNNYQMLNINQLMYYEDSLVKSRDSVIQQYQNYNIEDLAFLALYDREKAKDTINNIVDSLLQTQVEPELAEVEQEIPEVIQERKITASNMFGRVQKDIPDVVEEKSIIAIDTNRIDTNQRLNADFLSNFLSENQRKIVSSALQSIRNSSYHSSIIVTTIQGRDTYIVKHKIEWHRKFTLSFACIILFFIGAPLGAIIRKGGLGMPLVISIAMFVLYHILSIVGQKSVTEFVMEPWLGMWLASLAFLPLGIFFTQKATTDAPLLDNESWQKVFGKILAPFIKLWSRKKSK